MLRGIRTTFLEGILRMRAHTHTHTHTHIYTDKPAGVLKFTIHRITHPTPPESPFRPVYIRRAFEQVQTDLRRLPHPAIRALDHGMACDPMC